MARFVQIIEVRSSRLPEMEAAVNEWERATQRKRKARRRILCQDREDPGRYFNIVFFDTYEEAMENSALPETSELSQKMMSLAEGPGTFYNLDVLDDRSMD